MADTAEKIQKVTEEANKYLKEADDRLKAYNIDPKIAGNNAGDLLKASGAGAATGAGLGAAVGAAIPPPGIGLAVAVAVGAIAGALAGLFGKLKLGPSQEQIDLAKEYDKFNEAINAILATVPEPYQRQLALTILERMKDKPGDIWFCTAHGCAMTSMAGIREIGGAIDSLAKEWIAKASTARTTSVAAKVVGAVAIVGIITLIVVKSKRPVALEPRRSRS